MEARCNNTGCDKDSWNLQKHPSEYSRGVTCPECGTTNVDVEGAGGQSESASLERVEQGGGGQPAAPARQAGGAVDDLLTATDEEAPTQQRAQATQSIFSQLGGVVSRLLEYEGQKEEAREQVAQQADIQRVDQYPECEDCGFTFTGEDINLSSDRVRCPDCGAVYQLQTPQ